MEQTVNIQDIYFLSFCYCLLNEIINVIFRLTTKRNHLNLEIIPIDFEFKFQSKTVNHIIHVVTIYRYDNIRHDCHFLT